MEPYEHTHKIQKTPTKFIVKKEKSAENTMTEDQIYESVYKEWYFKKFGFFGTF